jgi:hypothetical protein
VAVANPKPETDDADELVREAKEAFKLCEEREAENREAALDDLKFGRLGEQWPDEVVSEREKAGLPVLTFNQLPAFIRQITNAARQNKPSIKIHPADDTADIHTAEVIAGLCRQIEVQSQAQVAYDTAIDCAASCGLGYWRINTAFADDDSFDLDLVIEQIANPFSVWGDPYDTGATSKNWNLAFIADLLTKDEFERRYKDAEQVDWQEGAYSSLDANWLQENMVRVAEWWTREEFLRTILMLSNQQVVGEDVYKLRRAEFNASGLTVVGERKAKSHKVRQRIMTGAEVLEDRVWPGRYIPIVPVYGEEVNVEGKRVFRSLIRDMKGAQTKFNFDRTKAAELLGQAMVNKFIGPKGAFDDPNWQWANDAGVNTLEIDPKVIQAAGGVMPQPIPFDGSAASALLQQAATALDDMKAISGIYEPAQGQQGNEVSGVAIGKRIAQSDNANFHFLDNLNRAIEHGGRILVDLIPYAYTGPRVIRVLGQDGERSAVQLGQAGQAPQDPHGQAQAPTAQGLNGEPVAQVMTRVYDLSEGKYDVVVETGPSFTTRRQEAASMMAEVSASQPQLASVLMPRLAKLLDWPGAEQMAADLQGTDPRLQELQQKLQTGAQMLQQTQDALRQAEAGLADFQVKLDQAKAEGRDAAGQLRVDGYNAETSRMKALYPKGVPVADPAQLTQLVSSIVSQLMTGTDIDPGQPQGPDLSHLAVGLNGQPLQPAA